ncbi:MAG: GEVED domain-containing protein, partial [Planctomycetota bacterium]
PDDEVIFQIDTGSVLEVVDFTQIVEDQTFTVQALSIVPGVPTLANFVLDRDGANLGGSVQVDISGLLGNDSIATAIALAVNATMSPAVTAIATGNRVSFLGDNFVGLGPGARAANPNASLPGTAAIRVEGERSGAGRDAPILRAVDGEALRKASADGTTFQLNTSSTGVLGPTTFEFESGFYLEVPEAGGVAMVDGGVIRVLNIGTGADVTFEIDKPNTPPVLGNRTPIFISNADTQDVIANRITTALNTAPLGFTPLVANLGGGVVHVGGTVVQGVPQHSIVENSTGATLSGLPGSNNNSGFTFQVPPSPTVGLPSSVLFSEVDGSQTFTIRNAATGGNVTYEFESGFAFRAPGAGGGAFLEVPPGAPSFNIVNGATTVRFEFNSGVYFQVPNGGGTSFSDQQTFTITPAGGNTVVFEFDENNMLSNTNAIRIPFTATPIAAATPRNTLADTIAMAINAQSANLGNVVAENIGLGRVYLGITPNLTIDTSPAPALVLNGNNGVAPGSIEIQIDAHSPPLGDNQNDVVNQVVAAINSQFARLQLNALNIGSGIGQLGGTVNHSIPQFQENSALVFGGNVGVRPGNIQIAVRPGIDTQNDLANSVSRAIFSQFNQLGLVPSVFGNGRINLGGSIIHSITNNSNLLQSGQPGVSPNYLIPFVPASSFTAANTAASISQAVRGASNTTVYVLGSSFTDPTLMNASTLIDGTTFQIVDNGAILTFEFEDITSDAGGIFRQQQPYGFGVRAGNIQVPYFRGNPTPAPNAPAILPFTSNQVTNAMFTAISSVVSSNINVALAAGGTVIRVTQTGLEATVVEAVNDLIVVNGQGIQFFPGSAPIQKLINPGNTSIIQIRLEESYTNDEISLGGIDPVTGLRRGDGLVRGVSSNGVFNFGIGADGQRINFPPIVPNSALGVNRVADGIDVSGVPVWQQVVGSVRGVSPGTTAIPFFAQDTANNLATRTAAALNNLLSPDINTRAQGRFARLDSGKIPAVVNPPANSIVTPIVVGGEGPGGLVTGITVVPNANNNSGTLYAVTDRGGLYRVDVSLANPAITRQPVVTTTYIDTSEADLLGIPFTGLTVGPSSVENGLYRQMLFGVDGIGNLYAFNTAGESQPIFVDGQTTIRLNHAGGTLNAINGIEFGDLDTNLWHTTTNSTTGLPGHGINPAFDGSRQGTPGNTAFYFGDEITRDYDFAGGAHGTLVTNDFSLVGYTAADQPVLYYTYFSEIERDNVSQDAFRVFISRDDGDWEALASNTPFAQTLHDNSNNWRQARIPLDAFAGLENLRLRFEFTTAGDTNVGHDTTTGDELRAISGAQIRDEEVVVIDGQGYEFDLGITLVTPSGALIDDGDAFTIDGRAFTFRAIPNDGSPPAVALAPQEIGFHNRQSASEVAQAVATELLLRGLPAIRNGNRLNLLDGNPRLDRIASQTGLPAEFIEGAEGLKPPVPPALISANIQVPIHAGMSRVEVASQLKAVLETAFTDQIILADDGSKFIDGDTFVLDDTLGRANSVQIFEFDSGFTLQVPTAGGDLATGGVADGDLIIISDRNHPDVANRGVHDLIFEFDKDGSFNRLHLPIAINNTDGRLAVVQQIEAALNRQPEAVRTALGIVPRVVTGGVQIVGEPGTTFTIKAKAFTPTKVFSRETTDNGRLPSATLTGLNGLGSITTRATIGDGSFAASSGDYDWYRIDNIDRGQIITVDIDAVSAGLDSVVGIYNSAGTLLALNDDDGTTTDSFLSIVAPQTDDYYVVVHGNARTQFVSTDVPRRVPAIGDQGGPVQSTLTISGMNTAPLQDLEVNLNVSHPIAGDLQLFLVSPTGTRVELFRNVGGNQPNFTNTRLDNEASRSILTAAAPFTGTFRPVGSLATLIGENPNGNWILEITDTGPGVGSFGNLTSWSLDVKTADLVRMNPSQFFQADAQIAGSGTGTRTAGDYDLTITVDSGLLRPTQIPQAERLDPLANDGSRALANLTNLTTNTDTANTNLRGRGIVNGRGLVKAAGTIGDGASAATGDYDWYRIDGVVPGEFITAEVDVTTLATASALLPVVEIYDPTGMLVSTTDYDTVTTDVYVNHRALVQGTYYVVVHGSAGSQTNIDNADSGQPSITTGDYEVTITLGNDSLAPMAPTSAGSRESDDTLTRALQSGLSGRGATRVSAVIGDGAFGTQLAGDYDWYQINNVVAGQIITLDVDAVRRPGGSTLDSSVGLYNFAGTLLAFNEDDGLSTDSFLSFSAPATGIYYVVVHGKGDQFQTDVNSGGSGPTNSLINTTGVYDLTVHVDTALLSARPFTPDETLFMGADPGDGQSDMAEPTGINGRGATIVNGFIGDAPATVTNGDYDWYRVTTRPGQRIVVDVETPNGGTLNPVVGIYDVNGNLLTASDNFLGDRVNGCGATLNAFGAGCDSYINFQLPQAGSYFVVVHGAGIGGFQANTADQNTGPGIGTTGAYQLTIQVDSEPVGLVKGLSREENTPTRDGGANPSDDGSINVSNLLQLDGRGAVHIEAQIGNGAFGATSGDYDFYRIRTVEAGQLITVDTNAQTLAGFDPLINPNPLNTTVGIYNVSGTLVASNLDDGETTDSFLTYLVPTPGDYIVVVHGFGAQFQTSPFNPGSGPGPGTIGRYELDIKLDDAVLPTGSPLLQREGDGTVSDDGDLNKAIPALSVAGVAVASGVIGNGPIDPMTNLPTGDYDWYRVSAIAGQIITVDVDAVNLARGSTLDSSVFIYDQAGTIRDQNDDDGSSTDSFLTFRVPVSGNYFVVVHGNGGTPQGNPLDSTTGPGEASIGEYQVTISLLEFAIPQNDGSGLSQAFGAPGVLPGNERIFFAPTRSFLSSAVAQNIASAIANSPLGVNTFTVTDPLTGAGLNGTIDPLASNRQVRLRRPSLNLPDIDIDLGTTPLDVLQNTSAQRAEISPIKQHQDLLRIIDHNVDDPGPLGFEGGLLPGDAAPFNPFGVTGIDRVGFADPQRGQFNNAEGIYLDDIIIGFAERGELVTGPSAGATFVVNPDVATNELLTGEYQLEIRKGARFLGSSGTINAGDGRTFDTNDRLSGQASINVARAVDIRDGDTFTIGDGINTVVYEFEDLTLPPGNPNKGVVQGRVAVGFNPLISEADYVIASRLRELINLGETQGVLNIMADSSDGFLVGTQSITTTSNQINLMGPVVLRDVATTLRDPDGVRVIPSPSPITTTAIGASIYDEQGDPNLFRDQGQLLIHSNRVSHSLEFGIVADAGARDTEGGNSTPHSGPVRNLRELNNNDLAPGVVISNNLLDDNLSGGIRFSGSPANAAQQQGSVPFGRIINNTVVQSPGTVATANGITIENSASPTVLNNVLYGFDIGIAIDASSQSTVLAGSIYQNNMVDNNFNNQEDFPISLAPTDSLFVNVLQSNFYLKEGSLAIDSSIDSLLDRDDFRRVKNPLEISPSPILAPDYDLNGLLRVDDPDVEPPFGIGENVFVDRGALDRSDFSGPAAVLVNPRDDDSAGVDLKNPVPTIVELAPLVTLSSFSINLVDGIAPADPVGGVGVDDFTVIPETVSVTRNGILLKDNIDYSFSYNRTSNTIQIISLAGIWPADSVYVVTLNNSDRFVITAPSGNQVQDRNTATINAGTSLAPNIETFEFDSGFAIQIPQTLTLQVPSEGGRLGGIRDKETFTITGPGVRTIFEFDNDGALVTQPNPTANPPITVVGIPISSTSSQDDIAQKIVDAIRGAQDPTGPTPINLGLNPVNLGLLNPVDRGRVHLGSTAVHTLTLNPLQGTTRLTRTGVAVNVEDGDFISLTDGQNLVRFEFDSDGSTFVGSIPIPFTTAQTHEQIATNLGAAIQQAIADGLINDDKGALRPTDLTNGLVHLGGSERHRLRISLGSNLALAPNQTPGVKREFGIKAPAAALRITTGAAGLHLIVPASGANIRDRETFTLTEHITGGTRTATFEFDKTGAVAPGNIQIPFSQASTQSQLATAISMAIATAGLGLSPTYLGAGDLQLGAGSANYLLDLSANSSVRQTGISDGQTFLVDDGISLIAFEFDFDSTVGSAPGAIRIPLTVSADANTIAAAIASAVNAAGLSFGPQGLPLRATNLGSGVVDAGDPGNAPHLWDISHANLTQTGESGGVRDGETFLIALNDGTFPPKQVTFEFDSNGIPAQSNTSTITFDPTASAADVANAMVPVLRAAGLGLNSVATGLGFIDLGGTSQHALTLPTTSVIGRSHLMQVGVPGERGSVAVRFVPDATFSSAEMAASLQRAINGSSLLQGAGVSATLGGGAAVFVDGAFAVQGQGNLLNGTAGSVNFVGAIKDLATNPLKANQLSGETQFTITLGNVDLDFGDAPDSLAGVIRSYPTTEQSNGAAHVISATNPLRLGILIDAESDGQPTVDATGDDNGGDDEDGVVFGGGFVSGFATPVTVTSSGVGFLDVWVDFNRDGDWTDAGEQVYASQPVVAGATQLTIVTPAGATAGATTARFRLSSTGGLQSTGLAADGEVEDYGIRIVGNSPPTTVSVPVVTASEDGAPFVIDLSTRFDDPDFSNGNNDSHVYRVVDIENETLLNATINGSILTLEFLENQNGIANVTVEARDQGGLTTNIVIPVTVQPVNDGPTLVLPGPDAVLQEDGPAVTIDLSTFVSDPDVVTNGDVLSYAVTPNSGGIVSATIAGSMLTLTPRANQTGNVEVTVTVSDSSQQSVALLVAVTVAPSNDPPTGVNDLLPQGGGRLSEDTIITSADGVNVLTNDFDIEGDLFTVSGFDTTSARG